MWIFALIAVLVFLWLVVQCSWIHYRQYKAEEFERRTGSRR